MTAIVHFYSIRSFADPRNDVRPIVVNLQRHRFGEAALPISHRLCSGLLGS